MSEHAWSRTILLVEDDEDYRLGLAEVLRGEGYLVTCAANGQEALGYLRGGVRPSLVLLDLRMPVMNGWDLRATMLQDQALSTIPVILLTAAISQADATTLQAAASLQKPFDVQTLLTMLDGTLLDQCAMCGERVGHGRRTVSVRGAVAAVLCEACAAREDDADTLSRDLQEVLAKHQGAHGRARTAN